MPKQTRSIYLRGKAKWAKFFKPDMKFAPGSWSVDLYPDSESYNKILELKKEGIKNVLKKDDDGYYMKFSRPVSKVGKNGRIRAFTPPEVLDNNNKGPDGYPLPLRVEGIGNGSDIMIKLDQYFYTDPYKNESSAVRLESALVYELVPFETKRDFSDADEKQVKGLIDQPEPAW
jgi:hypothetical protein